MKVKNKTSQDKTKQSYRLQAFILHFVRFPLVPVKDLAILKQCPG
jgi:hypothetical protein